jgi:hypothetical protein
VVGKPPPFFFLAIILTATFGAGVVDVIFTDVLPFRPYTAFFKTEVVSMVNVVSKSSSGEVIGDVFGATIVIILASSLFATIANFTTGRTIAHAGFTPNPNITASIGFVPVIQLIPFVFGAMVLGMTYSIFQRHLPGGL